MSTATVAPCVAVLFYLDNNRLDEGGSAADTPHGPKVFVIIESVGVYTETPHNL